MQYHSTSRLKSVLFPSLCGSFPTLNLLFVESDATDKAFIRKTYSFACKFGIFHLLPEPGTSAGSYSFQERIKI